MPMRCATAPSCSPKANWSPRVLPGLPTGSAARPAPRNCLRDENTARPAKLGLWGDPYYEVLNADTPVDVLAQRGRFALVEGQVVSVRESGATIYVNFGRRWSESFAVTISKRNERNFTAAGLDLKSLSRPARPGPGLGRGARRGRQCSLDRGSAAGADRDGGSRTDVLRSAARWGDLRQDRGDLRKRFWVTR